MRPLAAFVFMGPAFELGFENSTHRGTVGLKTSRHVHVLQSLPSCKAEECLAFVCMAAGSSYLIQIREDHLSRTGTGAEDSNVHPILPSQDGLLYDDVR